MRQRGGSKAIHECSTRCSGSCNETLGCNVLLLFPVVARYGFSYDRFPSKRQNEHAENNAAIFVFLSLSYFSAGLFWNFVKMWSWPILTRESLSSFFWVSIWRNISSFLGFFVEHATNFFFRPLWKHTIRAKDGALSSAVVRLILRLFECFHRCDSYSLPKVFRMIGFHRNDRIRLLKIMRPREHGDRRHIFGVST